MTHTYMRMDMDMYDGPFICRHLVAPWAESSKGSCGMWRAVGQACPEHDRASSRELGELAAARLHIGGGGVITMSIFSRHMAVVSKRFE